MKRLLCIILVLSVSISTYAKVNLILHQPFVVSSDSVLALSFNDESALRTHLQSLHNKALAEGYLLSSIDNYQAKNDTTYTATFYKGELYKWGNIDLSLINPVLLSKLNIAAASYQNKLVQPHKIAQLINDIHDYYENNGYPFAQVKLSLESVSEQRLYAQLTIDPLQYTTFDTIIIHGDVNVSSTYLQHYLGIKIGSPYKENAVKQISTRIRELNFIEESAPYNVHFALDGTKVNLYLKARKSNQINGLLGVQQDVAALIPKYMITADFLLKLKNAFGSGELIDVTFQNLQKQSPRFNFSGSYPYLFNTKFAADGLFEIYKKDTAYVNISAQLGTRYLINARDYIGLSYTNQSGRIVSPNLAQIEATKRLPKEIDFTTQGVQLHVNIDRTNYSRNPSKGNYAYVTTIAGLRKVKPNTAITSLESTSGFDFTTLYDTFTTQQYQYRVQGKIGYFIPINKQIVIHAMYNGGYISGNNLFMNELFQIGGYKILRGYDEQSIFVNQYHIGTAELRLLFDVNSYAYIFSDYGWYQSKYDLVNQEHQPFSLGLGLNLDNKNGAFTIAIGIGRPVDGGLQFRNAKLHFGYVAYF